MKSLILDVDTGIDDAIAILLAGSWRESVTLLGISCVGGNVSLDQVYRNTLSMLKLVDRLDVPVAKGAEIPLVEKQKSASNVHGSNGIAELELPVPDVDRKYKHAFDLYENILDNCDAPVTFVALAPLTNLALFIRAFPEKAKKISEIVLMGGAVRRGNASAVAEFNIWHDPEAAHIVLTSDIPVTIYSLDAFEEISLSEEELLSRTHGDSKTLDVVQKLLNYRRRNVDGSLGDRFALIGDAGAVISAVQPELTQSVIAPAHVNLSQGIGRGQTQFDFRQHEGEDAHHNLHEKWPLIQVITRLNREKAIDLLFEQIGNK